MWYNWTENVHKKTENYVDGREYLKSQMVTLNHFAQMFIYAEILSPKKIYDKFMLKNVHLNLIEIEVACDYTKSTKALINSLYLYATYVITSLIGSWIYSTVQPLESI